MILAHEEIQHLNLRFEQALQELKENIDTVIIDLHQSLDKPGRSLTVHRKNQATASCEAKYQEESDRNTTATQAAKSDTQDSDTCRSYPETVDETSQASKSQPPQRIKRRPGRPRKEPKIDEPRRTELELRIAKRNHWKPRPRKTVTRGAHRG
jgi:hypothetical protein